MQAPSGGHEEARAWPIEPATEAARAPRPASRIKQATAGLLARGFFVCRRLPRDHPSGQLRQAFRLQLRGSCGIRAKTRHRIPFSLLIFEETVNSASLKGAGAGLVNGDAPPADRACDGGTPVYSSGRRRFHYERDARRERGEEQALRPRLPRNCSGELPFTRSHWSHRSGKAEGTLRPASQ